MNNVAVAICEKIRNHLNSHHDFGAVLAGVRFAMPGVHITFKSNGYKIKYSNGLEGDMGVMEEKLVIRKGLRRIAVVGTTEGETTRSERHVYCNHVKGEHVESLYVVLEDID